MSTPTTPASDTSSFTLTFVRDKRRRRRKKHTMPKYFLQKNLRDEYDVALGNVTHIIRRAMKDFSFAEMQLEAKQKGGMYPKGLPDVLHKTLECYHSMRGPMINRYPIEVSHVYRQEIGEIYHKERFVSYLCCFVVHLLPMPHKTSSQKDVLDKCLNLLLDYTNFSETVVDDIMDNPAMVEVAVWSLKQPLTGAKYDRKMHVWMLYLMCNCARVPEHRTLMRGKFVSDLMGLLSLDPEGGEHMAILGTLAHIVNEAQARELQAKKNAISYIIGKLGDALNNYRPFMGRTLESGGWSCMELGEIIRQLARCDTNKTKLYDKGVVSKMIDLGNIDDIEKQLVALEVIWNLSFLVELRPKLVKNSKLMRLVIDLYEIRELQRAASGILWNLLEQMKGKPEFDRIVRRLEEDRDDVEFEDSDDDDDASPLLLSQSLKQSRSIVKLSYNLDNQSLVRRIREQLTRSGYRVRSSEEFQSASIPQAMEIVRRATVIIVCISQKYKDSEVCRAEAEQASVLRKAIIPLLLEKSYQPDGWVRDLLNDLRHFKFDSEHPFAANMEGLLHQVQDTVSRADTQVLVATRDPGSPHSKQGEGRRLDPLMQEGGREVTEYALETVRKMEPQTIQAWVAQFSLPSEKFRDLTGTKLAGWMRLMFEAPDFFYRSLDSQLGLTIEDGGVFKFADALDHLQRKLQTT